LSKGLWCLSRPYNPELSLVGSSLVDNMKSGDACLLILSTLQSLVWCKPNIGGVRLFVEDKATLIGIVNVFRAKGLKLVG